MKKRIPAWRDIEGTGCPAGRTVELKGKNWTAKAAQYVINQVQLLDGVTGNPPDKRTDLYESVTHWRPYGSSAGHPVDPESYLGDEVRQR
jgi:hypothetical protein